MLIHPHATSENIGAQTPENMASVWCFAVLDKHDVDLRRQMLEAIPEARELIREAKLSSNGRLKLLVVVAQYLGEILGA